MKLQVRTLLFFILCAVASPARLGAVPEIARLKSIICQSKSGVIQEAFFIKLIGSEKADDIDTWRQAAKNYENVCLRYVEWYRGMLKELIEGGQYDQQDLQHQDFVNHLKTHSNIKSFLARQAGIYFQLTGFFGKIYRRTEELLLIKRQKSFSAWLKEHDADMRLFEEEEIKSSSGCELSKKEAMRAFKLAEHNRKIGICLKQDMNDILAAIAIERRKDIQRDWDRNSRR